MRVSRPESGGVGGVGVVVGVVLLLFALAPSSATGWVTVFRGPLQTVVGPVSGPLSRAASVLRPAERRRLAAAAGVEELTRQRDRYELLWRQANRRVAALEERLATLEGWRSAVDVPVVARWGRVIGRELEAGTVSVRVRGESEVPVGSVAVDAGSRQLVGRVVATGPTAVSVRLITAAAGGERWLRCAVFPADGGAGLDAAGQSGLPRVDLRVAGGGRFESAPVGESGVLAAGARVRLDDASWPAEAQMLVVGVVREVRDHETPLMRVAEVVPTVDDLGAVSAVVLLTAEESDGAEPGVGSGVGSGGAG